uniref:Uncharacterized protein n=1 Tax=Ciona savignyi TaxID=51511 RepID=H2Z6W4_CIOSA
MEHGVLTEEDVLPSITQYLVGEQPIAGLIVDATGQKFGILECIQQGILKRGTGLELLEAQAAIGSIIEPQTGNRYSVADAMRLKLIDDTQKDTLERAQRAITGYRDPVTGNTLSLFEAMNKGYVTESRGIRLLEAQVATGGIVDPKASHRVPLSVAYQRGILSKKMFGKLTDSSDDTKGFFDPNTNENLTYLELLSRTRTEPETGLVFLPLLEKKKKSRTSSRLDASASRKKKKRTTQRSRKVVIVDPDSGAEMTVKEAYQKGLIDRATAKQLMQQEGDWTEETELTREIETVETTSTSSHNASSLSSQPQSDDVFNQVDDVNASWNIGISRCATMVPSNILHFIHKLTVLKVGLILTNTEISSGKKLKSNGAMSAAELSARLLQLSNAHLGAIGGIIDVEKEETISITEALKRRLVDGTSAQRLLEAQAATGGIINPLVPSQPLSINEALAVGLIDRVTARRLANAEKAFRGFPDRRSNQLLSLGEALKKGICYYEAGTRLLEVQYITGGLVIPPHGKRIPLDAAVAEGYIDQRMADRLGDIQRYAKSVVDLKTNLLISYPDALEKTVVDKYTGVRCLEA